MERSRQDQVILRGLAYRFIILFGVISALGDMTYEGARSVYGPYLALLGASAAVVGLVTGLGEFLGYALRLVSGYFIDRTKGYWLVAILGYGMLLAVPLLGLASSWWLAAVFIMLERTGKAIRSPGKDAMLSHATRRVGTGIGFGLHEVLDQIGGFIGPLIFTATIAATGGYKRGFIFMTVPALLTLAVVFVARARFPHPETLETQERDTAGEKEEKGKSRFPRTFWFYAAFIMVSVAGFVNFPILAFHFKQSHLIPEAQIPTLYAAAMGADALMALAIGKFYDRIGFRSLIVIPVLSIPLAVLGFSQSRLLIVFAALLWGLVMGAHETIMRAVIADQIPVCKRGAAYGVFNTVYGLAILCGSAVMGLLYERSTALVIGFASISELIGLVIFLRYVRLQTLSPCTPIRRP